MTGLRLECASLLILGATVGGFASGQAPRGQTVAQTAPQPGVTNPKTAPPAQLPVPIPLQATPPNPPPIPQEPEQKLPPPPQLREPGERFQKMEQNGYPENAFGKGHWCWSGWRYGPRVAPEWEYPGLGGGPKVSYPWGEPGYTGHNDERSLDRRCRLWGPPVPVYTPIPEYSPNKRMIYPLRNISSPGFIYGWVGPFPASPRPHRLDVDVWAQPGVDLSTGGSKSRSEMQKPPASNGPVSASGYLSLSVRVPDPRAELFVDGVKTQQTGLDRSFSSPELEPGADYRYEVTVRWTEGTTTYERKKTVIGGPGQSIPLDFTSPEVVRADK
jgi:uncharacterized protein (TIGR03000 family)